MTGYLLTPQTGLLKDSSSSESQTVNTQTSAASKTRIAQEEADGTLKRACLLNYHIGVADPDHHSGCPDQWGLPGGLRRP